MLVAFGSADPIYTPNWGCAVLSQCLALDINSTGYIASGFTQNFKLVTLAQCQIANHMRVCITVPNNLVSVYGVAASEPILSKAASQIMRDYTEFNLSSVLQDMVDKFSISAGDQGELLVAAFFTHARDIHARNILDPCRQQLPEKTQLCPVFSVLDLLSNLFDKESFNTTVLNVLPSVHPSESTQKKFGEVFKGTNMHFNHFIKPSCTIVISCQYLLNIMAHGAAALGANCQPGYNMISPFLYDTIDLNIKSVVYIIVQVKNTDRVHDKLEIFKKMDPFSCKLFKKASTVVPIIRILFSLRGELPSLKQMKYDSDSPEDVGALQFKHGKPCFTSYDFWCEGLGPGILQPVDETGTRIWESLLSKSNISDELFKTSKDPNLRRSEHPGGGRDPGFYSAWVPEPYISGDESVSDSDSVVTIGEGAAVWK